MGYPLNKAISQKRNSKNKLRPGVYNSRVKKVVEASGYQSGDAYTLVYELTSPDTGKVYEKKETFMNYINHDRTKELSIYLNDHGVDLVDFEMLVGLCETLTLEWVVYDDGTRFLNVINREFVGFSVEGGE